MGTDVYTGSVIDPTLTPSGGAGTYSQAIDNGIKLNYINC